MMTLQIEDMKRGNTHHLEKSGYGYTTSTYIYTNVSEAFHPGEEKIKKGSESEYCQ